MTRQETLDTAKKCVCGDRDEQYKNPSHLFAMWWNRQVQTQITDKTSIKTYCRNCTGDYAEVGMAKNTNYCPNCGAKMEDKT